MPVSGSARWLVVLVGFIALSLAFSTRSTLGLVMPVWDAEFGWSRSFISSGGAVALVLMAMIAPVVGNLVDSRGPRVLLIGGMLVMALGTALLSAVNSQFMFIFAFGGVAALGFGVVAMHVIATALAPLFDQNRGLATGIATSGATAGQLLVIPVFAVVMTVVGWRTGYVAMAVAAVAVALLFWLLLPRTPQRKEAPSEQRDGQDSNAARLSYLGRSRKFHALFWSFTICGFTTAGVIETHLMPYAALCGYPPLTSATAYGVLSAFNMLGMVAAGYLSDRVHRPFLLAGLYFLRAASLILLLFIANDISLLFVFAVAFGLFDYSTVPVTASLVASHLGLRIMGLAMGLLAMGHALGAAAGAFLGGYLFDLFAGYDEVWISSFALSVLAGFIALTIRERRAPDPEEEAAVGGDAGVEPALARS